VKRKFIKGLELSELFFQEAVNPILDRNFSGLVFSAALLGDGSEVLGFDTPQSTDHDWGPRLQLFLGEADLREHRENIDQALRRELPVEIRGYVTNFAINDDDTTFMSQDESAQINHRVDILSIQAFFEGVLNFDPMAEIRAADWVSVPEHNFRKLTAGRVFCDDLGQLELIRDKLRNYPHDIWLYLLSTQWQRISQEEHFMGRCGQVEDDLGSRLIAARLVRDLMRLCFLIEREYAPYIKWFGTAFNQLACAADLVPVFQAVLQAASWEQRQQHLSTAYETIAAMHNALNITQPLSVKVTSFFNRPFQVINAGRFVEAIRAQIEDPDVLALPKRLGGFDQFVDSTDALVYVDQIKAIYI
jgi:hypothetical protein